MKKSLVALAVLGGFSGVAAAQSSVTLFGVLDVNARYVKNDGFSNRKSLSQDGIQNTRLGLRGVEDLGGGLRAAFWLEGAMQPDTGTPGGQTWQRRSTVSLLGGFGEVRLGRDYTPTFWNNTTFDPFNTQGVGSATNVSRFFSTVLAPTNSTFVRANNSIGYFLPDNIGGVYGQLMVAAGEGAAGKYNGGRLGFRGGLFNVAVAIGQQDTNVAGTTEYQTANIGASWNLGFVTLTAQFSSEKNEIPPVADQKERRWQVGASFPLGQGELRASYVRSDASGGAAGFSANDANLIAVGYIYNLSKRTALYVTGSRIDNKGAQAFSVAGGTASPGGPTGGGTSLGFEGGLRHSF